MKAIIPEIVYGCFCLFWAFVNYWQIEKINETVRHGINGIFHLSTVIYFSIAIHPLVGAAMLFEGRLFFDVPLNIMRDGWRNIGYVPKNPKSIVDQLEQKVFGKNGIAPKVVYLVILFSLVIIQLKVIK